MIKKIKSYNELNFKVNKDNNLFEFLFALWVHKSFFKILGKLCDMGPGNGSNSISFKKIGYDVSALDIDDFYLLRFISNGIAFKKINLDSKKLPFNNNELDYLFAKSVIEHLTNPLDFIKEASRVLKKGGKIFILTPDWQKNYKNFYSDPTHKSPFTKRSLAMALEMNGFKVIKIRNFRNIPYLWRYFGTRVFDFTWFGADNMIAVAEKI